VVTRQRPSVNGQKLGLHLIFFPKMLQTFTGFSRGYEDIFSLTKQCTGDRYVVSASDRPNRTEKSLFLPSHGPLGPLSTKTP
jgi:hypothetical protein